MPAPGLRTGRPLLWRHDAGSVGLGAGRTPVHPDPQPVEGAPVGRQGSQRNPDGCRPRLRSAPAGRRGGRQHLGVRPGPGRRAAATPDGPSPPTTTTNKGSSRRSPVRAPVRGPSGFRRAPEHGGKGSVRGVRGPFLFSRARKEGEEGGGEEVVPTPATADRADREGSGCRCGAGCRPGVAKPPITALRNRLIKMRQPSITPSRWSSGLLRS
jgi:hypothetical protein